jgi:hypothetical protein
MPLAKDVHGTVFRGGTATLMARIANGAGEPINQASLLEIRYTVYQRAVDDPDDLTPVAGHDAVELAIAEAVFDAPVDDAAWTIDETGYNFRHEIDASGPPPFARAGAIYQVRYELTPVAGQKIVVRFQLRCI